VLEKANALSSESDRPPQERSGPGRVRIAFGRLLLLAAAVLALSFVLRAAGMPRLVLWEYGESMPTGLYVFSHRPPAEQGEVIVMDKAPNWGRSYLMKRVEGVPGDRYCWDAAYQAHRLNGRLMPGISPLARLLEVPVWQGCRQLDVDEYVGYGDSENSYDSRHIGPIKAAEIAGIYRLVLSSASRPSQPPHLE